LARTVLLYGRTNSGKTAQIGELAEDVFKRTGKITRLATADRGGIETIKPYIDLGIIEPVEMLDSSPWIFLNKVVRGYKKDSTGKWILDPVANEKVGLWAFESLRAVAESLMLSMAHKAAQGVNIGGGSNISFQEQGEGETLKISGSNMAHFGVAQARVTEEVWESQKLKGEYVMWTSSVSKDADELSSNKVLGPDVIGKALTGEVPRWFDYSFRIDVLPAQGGKPERHILYLGNHVDLGAGNAAGLGNLRRPMDAKPMAAATIEPASLVKALQQLESGNQEAVDVIRKRLGIK